MANDTKTMREFREAVLTGIGELKVEVVNIVSRLDKINGRVNLHDEQIARNNVNDAKHEAVLSTIATLKADVDALKTASTTTSEQIRLTGMAAKAVWGAVGGTLILLWQNAPALLKLVEPK
jgi:seryl-tRNA synthetase